MQLREGILQYGELRDVVVLLGALRPFGRPGFVGRRFLRDVGQARLRDFAVRLGAILGRHEIHSGCD